MGKHCRTTTAIRTRHAGPVLAGCRRANAGKLGIDFNQAKELWRDPYLIEIPAMTVDEPRYLVIGRVGAKHRSAVITYRSDHIRTNNVRPSRTEEVAPYVGAPAATAASSRSP